MRTGEAGQAEVGGGFLSRFFSSDGIVPRVLLPVHIVLSGLMNLVGPFQFNSVIRRRWTTVHRRLGYTFFPAAIGAGITAILITVINPTRYTTLNYLSNWAFGGWLAATAVMALVMIRRRQIRSHQRWGHPRLWSSAHRGNPPRLGSGRTGDTTSRLRRDSRRRQGHHAVVVDHRRCRGPGPKIGPRTWVASKETRA